MCLFFLFCKFDGSWLQSLQAEGCIDLSAVSLARPGGWRPKSVLKEQLTLLMHPEIQPKDIFNFPEFLHYPIRCARTAHDDDLGLFIPARLNIYFSAQGEAEKKNVSLQVQPLVDLTPALPLPPPSSPSTLLTFTRQLAPKESWDTH